MLNITMIAVIGLVAFLLGAVASHLWRAIRLRQSPLNVDGLAEREDVNGCMLVAMAQDMKRVAEGEQREPARKMLLQWARQCEQVAVDHLTCINALTLEARQALFEQPPIHLGEFRPTSDRRRNPPLQRMGSVQGVRHG